LLTSQLFAGGMFTANTMSSSVEALGMALPGIIFITYSGSMVL
jgi:dihydroxyacid dehydratase/phosphogluconate dehydratase